MHQRLGQDLSRPAAGQHSLGSTSEHHWHCCIVLALEERVWRRTRSNSAPAAPRVRARLRGVTPRARWWVCHCNRECCAAVYEHEHASMLAARELLRATRGVYCTSWLHLQDARAVTAWCSTVRRLSQGAYGAAGIMLRRCDSRAGPQPATPGPSRDSGADTT